MKRQLFFTMLMCLGIIGSLQLSAQNYFAPGTEWNVKIIRPGASFLYETLFMRDIDNQDENVYGLYSYSTGTDPSTAVCKVEIKNEGEKIFFKDPSDERDQWYLMYDFGLNVGDSSEIYTPYFLQGGYAPDCITLTCREIIENNTEFSGLTTMTMVEIMDVSDDSNIDFEEKETTWLKGLGDFRGPLSNFSMFLIGGGSLLETATVDNDLIYTSPFTKIDRVNAAEPLSIRLIDNQLTVSSDNIDFPIWVYSIDGSIIKKIDPKAHPEAINLPAKGVYIVKAGNTSVKVVY